MKFGASQLALLLMVILTLVGCRREDPNPENMDPIYKDLKTRADSYQKEVEESKKSIDELRKALEKAEPRSIELKNIAKDLAKSQAKYEGAEQLARYYKIRAERRRLMGRKAYRAAFAQGKEWPDPHEYSDYLVNTRLNEVNLNWNARVPKLSDRTPAKVVNPAQKPKSTDAGEGGGEH
jgi:hypothetical protein